MLLVLIRTVSFLANDNRSKIEAKKYPACKEFVIGTEGWCVSTYMNRPNQTVPLCFFPIPNRSPFQNISGFVEMFSKICAVMQSRQNFNMSSNNVVCVTSKALDQLAYTHSLIRAFASRLNILYMLSY